MRTRSKALPVLLTALLVLGGTVGVSYAHAVQITQKQSPRQLKQSCDKAGGAYGIITRKGATYYAVAAGLMRLVEAIVRDQHTILAVSSLVRELHGIDDICLSLPTVIGRAGIVRMLRPSLAPEELAALRHSAEVLTAAVAASGL